MAATVRLIIPVLFVTMGGAFGHKASALNIGLESFMAFSAFFAMYGSYLFESAWMGLLSGVISATPTSCVFAVSVLYLKFNPVVTGIALNLAGWGVTSFLLGALLHTRGVFIDAGTKNFPSIHTPVLKDIPYLEQVLSGQNILVYLAVLVAALSYMIMYKTPFGPRLWGAGIKSVAAQTAGVDSNKYQWVAILLGGILSGVEGAFLTTGGSSMFTENTSAGKGFPALAAIVVGNGNPMKTVLACLVFGYTQALSVTLQSTGLPSQTVIPAPYLITIIIMFVSAVVIEYRYKFVKDCQNWFAWDLRKREKTGSWMVEMKEARIKTWEELLEAVRPDSKFSWNLSEFIADYEGSNKGAELLAGTKMYRKAEAISITPDNNLEKFRGLTFRDRRTVVMTNYGITRGFFLTWPEFIPEGKEELASLLGGVSRYWKHQTLEQLKAAVGHIDILVTGTSVITPSGIRFGKGHGYFDLEWATLYTMGLVDGESVIAGAGHDRQIVDVEVTVEEYDTVIDYIVTLTRTTETGYELARPTKEIIWSRLAPGMWEQIPPMQGLWCRVHCK